MIDMDMSKIRQKIGRLSRERWSLEQKLVNTLSRESLLKGSFIEKYKACNKGGCKCTKGELHGPFRYLSLSRDGKTKMIFIKRSNWQRVADLTRNYRKWRLTRARITRINEEILSLIGRMKKEITVEVSSLEEQEEK